MERAFAELIRRGHERYDFVVFAVRLDEELRGLVRWHRIRLPMRPATLLTPLFSLIAGIKLARERADLVHTQGAIIPNRVDVATVHFCHAGHRELTGRFAPSGAPLLRRLNTTVARRIALAAERWSYRPGRVRMLAAVSPGVAAEVRRHYARVPVVLTPNGVDLERFRPDSELRAKVREQHAIRADEIVVLFVGGDWNHKGVGVAIEGLAEAQRRTPRQLRLWIVGRGNERRFGALAEHCGIGERVEFMGPQPATERFYQAADVFVVLSLYETFSLVAHEAAAAGVPVVSTRVSGIEDLLGDGDSGLIVERTAQSVGAAIALLAADDALRERLGAAGNARVSSATWERSIDSVTALYDTLLGRPGDAPTPSRSLLEAGVR
jgi:UDP-glucose:(heptosyl)LPS alpha-1,3-glucosyltransferase